MLTIDCYTHKHHERSKTEQQLVIVKHFFDNKNASENVPLLIFSK